MAISGVPGYISGVGYGSGAGGGFGYPGMSGFQRVAIPSMAKLTPSTLTRQPVGGGGIGPSGGFTPAAPATLGFGQVGSGGGGGGGGGGSPQTVTTIMTPNQVYESDILSDPGSVAALGTFNAQTTQLANARADAIQRAIINSGYTPQMTGGLESYAGDVTPDTLARAAANPMSQLAQLNLQLQQANTNLPYDLAAGGQGRSGASAIEQGNLQRQYQTSQYQGMQDLLNSLYGAGSNYASGYNSALGNLDSARAAVAARLAQMAGYSQTVTTTGGDSGGGGGGDYGDLGNTGEGGFNDDGSWTVPGYDVPPAPAQATYLGSPGYMANPTTQAAVQRVVNAIKQPSPRIYQNLRNVMAG